MKTRTVLTLVMLCFASTVLAVEQPALIKVDRPDSPTLVGYVPGEIIVQFKAPSEKIQPKAILGAKHVSLNIQSLDEIAERFEVTAIRQEFEGAKPTTIRGRVYDLSRHYLVKFDPALSLDEALAAYRANPNVESAEPIGVHSVNIVPNDPFFIQQWHLDRLDNHDVDAPEAWNIQTGNSTIIVAILDTGVRYFHKDLGGANASFATPDASRGSMWINDAELNGIAGVDDDGNGFIDDQIGWDFVTGVTGCWPGEDCSTADNDPRDFNGHGTHLAGIVAAGTNDGFGVSGVAGGFNAGVLPVSGNGVRIMALRIGWSANSFGQEAGFVRMDFAAQALFYAANNGARIANASWGSSNSGGIGAAVDFFI